ncbi:hypothetical protein PsorP6_001012 [Peronosclerospora sorghi]|uniref:Uncharacterized protein n=1 Tax=Peronosclerospora sorghi TaxID=230839 RepID=A0ACC0WW97_9STRA|nr:hypothetical protein PsorP6_001012 [Peronosclerospora sorghi]
MYDALRHNMFTTMLMQNGRVYELQLESYFAGIATKCRKLLPQRCLVCGCEIERRQTSAPGQHAHNSISETSVRELHVAVMRFLSELGGDWNRRDTESRRPASDEAGKKAAATFVTYDSYIFFIADQASTIEVGIVVKGIKGEVIIVPSNFGPCETLKDRNMVIGDPFDGAETFRNANEMEDKVLVMTRGGCTFARKVLRAQAAGAAGVIIIQTADVWPYTMTDSTGESKDVKIPAFMMSSKHGKGFVEYLRGKHDTIISADIIVRKDGRECVICQVEMALGMKITRMPCQHMFHTECLHEWLRIGNSCPICRVEIAAKTSAPTNLRTALERGDLAWSEWFS